MADADFSLLSLLKAHYPSVPSTVVLRVMNKFDNNEDMCRKALDSEVEKRFNTSDEPFQPISASRNTNSNNNLESPVEGKSITSRIKELQKSHEGSPQPKSFNPERHVTTIERSIGNISRATDQSKRPYIGQSVSWTVQPPDRLSPAPPQLNRTPTSSMTTPQTAPSDFTPFFINPAKDIPNNCSTSGFGPGTAGPSHFGTRPHQIAINSSSATSSPVEQRRPVKVINIPPGSLSGGSVSPAATPPNPRHIHMHFGDTGGICTISAPSSTLHHYDSMPNVSQQYRSEIRTEAPTPQPVHSSSIVVNTSNYTNHLTPDRKLSISNSGSDSALSGRRTPNPPMSFKTGDLVPNAGPGMFSAGKMSMPVQASSPGAGHPKPVFVEIKTDRVPVNQMQGGYDSSYPAAIYQGGTVKPPPTNLSFMPHQSGPYGSQNNLLNYKIQYNTDFPTNSGYPPALLQEHMYHQNPVQTKHPGYNNPPSNLYQSQTSSGYSPSSHSQMNLTNLYQPQTSSGYSPSSHSQMNLTNLYQPQTSSGYSPSSHSQLNPPTNLGYPSTLGLHPSQTPGHLFHYSQYNSHAVHSPGAHIPKSPSSGIGQMSLGSRSDSQDSEHSVATDFDARHLSYNAMGSRVSSHSSLSSDSSSSHLERNDSAARPRSGSIQDDAEYIRILVQHQQSQVQKLLDEMNHHNDILENLHSEVSMMEKNMIEASHASRSFPSIEDISRLCESNRQLQTDIQLYMNEIDMYKSGQTPFNKINPRDQQNFFDNMPTGQQDPIYSRASDDRSTSPRPTPPPRPPPPIPARQRSTDPMLAGTGIVSTGDIFCVPPVPTAQPMINSGDSEEGESWSCSACTFFNHPALKKCEMCEMPRVMAHQPGVSSLAPPIASTHQSMSSLAPRLPSGLVGSNHHRSASPHSALGQHHHHHAGT